MPLLIEADTGPEAYKNVLRALLKHGEPVAPRNQPTLEIQSALVVIADPARGVPAGIGRKMNAAIGYAEATQLLAGVSDLAQLNDAGGGAHSAAGGRFQAYSDDGYRLKGAYGPRVHARLRQVIGKLAKEPDTRQAVATIFRDENMSSKDVPCTVSLGFSIRRARLLMSVHMRSNDTWLGMPYDLWQFTRLQMTAAWALGIPAGPYSHYADSLHLYNKDATAADRLLDAEPGAAAAQPASLACPPLACPPGAFPNQQALHWWDMAVETAWLALRGMTPSPMDAHPDLATGAAAARRHLIPNSGRVLCRRCRYMLPGGQMSPKGICYQCASRSPGTDCPTGCIYGRGKGSAE